MLGGNRKALFEGEVPWPDFPLMHYLPEGGDRSRCKLHILRYQPAPPSPTVFQAPGTLIPYSRPRTWTLRLRKPTPPRMRHRLDKQRLQACSGHLPPG